jgi:hypothetical protein
MSEQKKKTLKEELIEMFSNKHQDEKWVEKLKLLLRTHFEI